GSWTEQQRAEAREHVMRHVLEIDEAVRTAPEDRRVAPRPDPSVPGGTGPAEPSPARREVAVAAVEGLLIRDGAIGSADAGERGCATTGARRWRSSPRPDRHRGPCGGATGARCP